MRGGVWGWKSVVWDDVVGREEKGVAFLIGRSAFLFPAGFWVSLVWLERTKDLHSDAWRVHQ